MDADRTPVPRATVKETFVRILKFILFLGIGLFILWLFQQNLSEEDKRELLHALRGADLTMVSLIILFGFLSNVFRTLRWDILLRPLGYKPRFLNTFASILVAYFANLAIPRLGEVLRCTSMYRYENIPVQKSLGTVVSERVIDILCFFVLFLLSFLLEYKALHSYVSRLFSQGMASRRGLMLVVGIFIFFLIVAAVGFFIYYRKNRHRLSPDSFCMRVVRVFKGFGEGFLSLRHMNRPWWFLVCTLGIWISYWAMMYFAIQSLSSLSSTGLGIALIALTMGTIGIMITPGGIGLYPVIISETIGIFGFSKTMGYAAGWVAWGTQTALIIVSGLFALALLPALNRKRR